MPTCNDFFAGPCCTSFRSWSNIQPLYLKYDPCRFLAWPKVVLTNMQTLVSKLRYQFCTFLRRVWSPSCQQTSVSINSVYWRYSNNTETQKRWVRFLILQSRNSPWLLCKFSYLLPKYGPCLPRATMGSCFNLATISFITHSYYFP